MLYQLKFFKDYSDIPNNVVKFAKEQFSGMVDVIKSDYECWGLGLDEITELEIAERSGGKSNFSRLKYHEKNYDKESNQKNETLEKYVNYTMQKDKEKLHWK